MTDFNLNELKPTRNFNPPRMIIYGKSGIGKSTFASQAPSPVFMDIENGLDNIETTSQRITSYQDALKFMAALLQQEHNFKTLVIDSADWMENLIFDRAYEVHKETGGKAPDFGSIPYGQGYSIAIDLWQRVINGLNKLRHEKNMIIILLAHLDTKRHDSPLSDVEAFDIYTPKLHGKTSKGQSSVGLLTEWADIIGFADYELRTKEVDKGFGNKDKKALSNAERLLYTNSDNPAFIAKTRYKIPAPLPFEWDKFYAALINSISKKDDENEEKN